MKAVKSKKSTPRKNTEQLITKTIDKSYFWELQMPIEFRIRDIKNVGAVGDNSKRSIASKMKSSESTSRPKFRSEEKIKNRNFVIKRSNTPDIERSSSFLHHQKFEKISSLKEKQMNEVDFKSRASPVYYFHQTEQSQMTPLQSQNIQLAGSKLGTHTRLKSKASLRCKILLTKNSMFPFIESKKKKAESESSSPTENSKQGEQEPFILNISRINALDNFEPPCLISRQSYQETPIF